MKQKGMMQRFWCGFLAFAMMLTILPMTVFAATDETVEEGSNIWQDTYGDNAALDAEAVYVTSAEELESALSAKQGVIRITSDFVIDRTFYVTSHTIIFTGEQRILTRASNFAGDIFVVGETREGSICEEAASLTLGSPHSTQSDLLVIDGNADKMDVDVVGSAIFVAGGHQVDIYANTTVQNHHKVGNERTQTGLHTVSYPERVGGAAAILAGSSTMNIYGGTFASNSVGEADISFQGGAIYNYGKLNIYGGLFQDNYGGNGGVFFNYRTMNIHRAEMKGNSATTGGAIYVPNSTAAFTYIGETTTVVESGVIFQENFAGSGGAIYASNVINIENTTFTGNYSTSSYGGAIRCNATRMSIDGCVFTENVAKNHGGAIYTTGNNGKENILELTITNTLFGANTATSKGGVLYISGENRVFLQDVELVENKGVDGAAIYATNSSFEIDRATIATNESTGGAPITLMEGATAVMNKVSALNNKGTKGGVLYGEASTATIYNSEFKGNASSGSGGALFLNDSMTTQVYKSLFEGNTAKSNSGAVHVYTNYHETTLHSCTFINNTAGAYGGAIYVAKQSTLNIYNAVATGNTGSHGGFMYHTAYDTVVNIAGLTLSGNTATTGGPIIWGNTTNAKLFLDKGKYIDLDETGDWDDAYWTNAIFNLLTVKYMTIDIPDYEDYDGALITTEPPVVSSNVSTSAQLERALSAGVSTIYITSDFVLDRTLYVTYDVTILSTGNFTLTRASDFDGDLFVVGEDENGTACDYPVVLTLGSAETQEGTHLTIDGNKANLTADVLGSALFLLKGNTVNIYDGITFQNHKKLGNSKTLTEKYTVSYPERVGGAVAIITGSSTMNIYGGAFVGNEADMGNENGFQGGAFYNYGTVHVYGGLFENNQAGSGGAFFNYHTLYIHNAELKGNYAETAGGAIYMPNSTASFLYIGEATEDVEGKVLFENNSANGAGGAIYARNKLHIENTTFKGNQVIDVDNSGAAIAAYTTVMTIDNCIFLQNVSAKHAGAIYLSEENGKEEAEATIRNTLFQENQAISSGGALYVYKGAKAYVLNSNFIQNTAATGGVAFVNNSFASMEVNNSHMQGNTSTSSGGAFYVNTDASILLNNILAEENEAGKTGGFVYGTSTCTVSIYNSQIQNNTAQTGGGALYLNTGTSANVYATTFEGNITTTGQGGAIFAYTGGGKVLLHSCTLLNNTANKGYGGGIYASGKADVTIYNMVAKNNSAANGGFLYHTTTNTFVTIVGLTISGNTATTGGPIIWGNSTGAKLYLDKAKYVDLDHTGAYDSDYYATAIVNKLTVYDYEGEVPKYLDYGNEAYEHMKDAVDVSSSAELEAALEAKAPYIRIVADFILDRSFFITYNVTIFSTIERTLTRAPGFGGDIFVVGEDANGTSTLLLGQNATLTFGNSLSIKEHLLTVDGNRDNMVVDVTGSVFFVCNSSYLNLYTNATIQNCYKAGNERALNSNYDLNSPSRVGGSVAVIQSGICTVYGGYYANNAVNSSVSDETLGEEGYNSSNGGVFYNFGNLVIYGGTFEGNYAARGGIAYNYRVAKLYGGTFTGNSAMYGAIIYAPSVAPSHVYIGNTTGTSQVLFENNFATGNGGAFYTGYLVGFVVYGNTIFRGNQSASSGGAICAYSGLILENAIFENNQSGSRGGAIYASNSSSTECLRYSLITNCTFTGNQAIYGGAVSLYAYASDAPEGAIVTFTDCQFVANVATNSSGSNGVGGAIYADRCSSLKIYGGAFEENFAATEGGAIYGGGGVTMVVKDAEISNNVSLGHAGGISAHSVTLTLQNVTITGNTSVTNGAGLYISYIGSLDFNSSVTITDSVISNNISEGNGGGIYATRHDVTNEKRILSMKNVTMEGNVASKGGGAICLMTLVDAYFRNVTFTGNSSLTGNGGAVYATGSTLTIDGGTFTANVADDYGGGIAIYDAGVLKLNNITATDNVVTKLSGGFLVVNGAQATVYNSVISGNKSLETSGGAVAFLAGASGGVYNTTFEGNYSKGTGGAVIVYTGGGVVTLHTCTFVENASDSNGGAVYVSNKGILNAYNITATNNTANLGAFMYITTTGSVVTLSGATLSGNIAQEGGNQVYGNSTGATLKWNSSNVTVQSGDFVEGKLTVEKVSTKVPTYKDFTAEKESTSSSTTKPNTLVPVDDMLQLGQSSSDGSISSSFNKLPTLDNSSNFMSKETTTFDNINGGTVTVDTFVYPAHGKADNVNVGQGLLIYQAILYKQAYPDEEVYIDISSYRFSVQAAVNINRNSRYFGYMRNLSKVEYDEFGFVRISYLLVAAAKMGIHVTAIGQIDAYPTTAGEKDLVSYFKYHANDPCDPAYVSDGSLVGDYLNFQKCKWSLEDGKGGTDMMHNKLCAVSHYLDMNGVVHKNAVWTSSANLDGISSSGSNGNWKIQTATIVSDHEEIYRTSINYIRLLANNCGQEDIYDFQRYVNEINTAQALLFQAGRQDEIPDDEQIIYLGTPEDQVFELYFTPMGGGFMTWDELNNPYAKYLRKLYNSVEYIVFVWNAAE